MPLFGEPQPSMSSSAKDAAPSVKIRPRLLLPRPDLLSGFNDPTPSRINNQILAVSEVCGQTHSPTSPHLTMADPLLSGVPLRGFATTHPHRRLQRRFSG
ncbi:hypothetical protein MLD38_022330 [Melastoma candidum]|uniref:Uncharacterized protein n=1 Tax=Melastoma candidum TaxID=119954 RepID=A0ACB9QMA8_9MYRT|nr:hypothetical protein MLD38_022330 [Melastoma candidum]